MKKFWFPICLIGAIIFSLLAVVLSITVPKMLKQHTEKKYTTEGERTEIIKYNECVECNNNQYRVIKAGDFDPQDKRIESKIPDGMKLIYVEMDQVSGEYKYEEGINYYIKDDGQNREEVPFYRLFHELEADDDCNDWMEERDLTNYGVYKSGQKLVFLVNEGSEIIEFCYAIYDSDTSKIKRSYKTVIYDKGGYVGE